MNTVSSAVPLPRQCEEALPCAGVNDSSHAQHLIDEALDILRVGKVHWVATDTETRIAILDELSRDLQAIGDRWVAAGMQAKDIDPGTFAEGEEWIYLGIMLRLVRLLRQSLEDIQQHGRPQIQGPVMTRPDGQVVAQVFPQTHWERNLIYKGITAEVWMEAGVTVEEMFATQAWNYRTQNYQGKIALVLGAGNVSMLVSADCLYKLFVDNQVVVLKPNPVNAYVGKLLEEGFRALIQRGSLRIIYGEAEEGASLCHHPAVDELHLTGSDKTFEAIVFGAGEEGAKRKARREPRLQKRFTAELGNVSPVILVPGPWTESELEQQAAKLAVWLVNNAGFNCLTPRVIIQHQDWPQRQAFIAALQQVLTAHPARKAYYPGAKQRMEAFEQTHPEVWKASAAEGDRLPWALITELDSAHREDICFRSEAFCSLSAETGLAAPTVVEFIDRAVAFANTTLWGTLTATIMVHPDSLADPAVAEAVERAVADLRYGMVLVNHFGGFGYFLGLPTWGGFPGHDVYDVQSGIGVVNNTLMFQRPQKSVVRAPFASQPDPVSVKSRRFHRFGKQLAHYEAAPSLWKLPGYLWASLRA